MAEDAAFKKWGERGVYHWAYTVCETIACAKSRSEVVAGADEIHRAVVIMRLFPVGWEWTRRLQYSGRLSELQKLGIWTPKEVAECNRLLDAVIADTTKHLWGQLLLMGARDIELGMQASRKECVRFGLRHHNIGGWIAGRI